MANRSTPPLTIEALEAAVDVLKHARAEAAVVGVPKPWLDRAQLRARITGRTIETEVIGLAVEALRHPGPDDQIGFRPKAQG